jgi:hypothetical protein
MRSIPAPDEQSCCGTPVIPTTCTSFSLAACYFSISGELSDVLLSALDARRRMLTSMGEGGLVLAGDDDRDLHRLQEFAQRNQLPYRTVLRSDATAWSELGKTTALPEAGTDVVTGARRVMTEPTTRDLATALGIDLWGLADDSRCDLLVVGAGPAGLAAAVYGAVGGAGHGRRRGCRHRGSGRQLVADRELPWLPRGRFRG